MSTQTESIIKLAFAVLTGVAAALGVQLSPAARVEDVSAVVRSELSPLQAKLDHVAKHQDEQDARLVRVEAVVLHNDATSTKE